METYKVTFDGIVTVYVKASNKENALIEAKKRLDNLKDIYIYIDEENVEVKGVTRVRVKWDFGETATIDLPYFVHCFTMVDGEKVDSTYRVIKEDIEYHSNHKIENLEIL